MCQAQRLQKDDEGVEPLLFANKDNFRDWLKENCLFGTGVWVLFGKAGGPVTLTPREALEEALCFGWIDGQIKSLNETAYAKYFSPRRKGGEWSLPNIRLAEDLEKQGRMTEFGRVKIEEAKQGGTFKPKARQPITPEMIGALVKRLDGTEPAHTNFLAMSPSVQRTYAALFHEGKTEQTREKTLQRIAERLNKNLKPM